jgi:GNAT superfamily N-acetyltransferase
MKAEIRLANTNDSPGINQLTQQLGYEAMPEDTLQRISEINELKNHCIYVAADGEKVTGWIHAFLAISVESGKYIEIAGLVVSEKQRGLGIGKLLVEKVLEWSLEMNCPKIRVRCNTKRKEAHKFYEKLGFAEIKEQKVFLKNLENS